MKVMQINCVYKKGSTGKIMNDIHNELLRQGIESVVCYGRGAETSDFGVYKTSSEVLAKFNNVKSRFTGNPYGGSFFATNKLLKIIKKEKPDVVHLHCINGFFVNIYRLMNYLKKNKIPTVVTHHAEFLYTGNCSHSFECEKWKTGCGNCPSVKKAVKSYVLDFTKHNFKKMKKAFEGFDNLISVGVSPWVQSRVEQSPIFKEYKNITILNGLNTEVFKPIENDLREKFNLKDKKTLLHVTASFSDVEKGGRYIIELAKRLPEVAFVVVGNKETPEVLPENLIAVGRVENQTKLAQYYTMADLTIVTSRRETFSMPVAESLACGTPVVGFKAGGPESIGISEYSEFVDFGDLNKLEEIISKWLLKNTDDKCSELATEFYSGIRMSREYIKVYHNLLMEKE